MESVVMMTVAQEFPRPCVVESAGHRGRSWGGLPAVVGGGGDR